jgi:hypothetical protein
MAMQAVLYMLVVCSFSALRGKTAHKMIDTHHAAAGEKRICEMQNNATA